MHGDDFVTKGAREDVRWLKKKLEERFEIKTKIIGTGTDEVREARILNRIVRVTPHGWEYEPDQRHADLIVDMMNLGCAKEVTTPYEDEKDRDQESGDEELPTKDHKQFRMIAARANYLAMDRPDIQYATKEICRGMATPKRRHWRMLISQILKRQTENRARI